MSPDATQNPAQPLFIVCSGVPDIDQDGRPQSPMDCESNNASGPECARLDGNEVIWCGKREVNDDLDLEGSSIYGSNSTDDEHSLKEDTNDPLLNGNKDDSTEKQPSVQLRSVLVPVRDPQTKQIKHELVPIEIMDETGLNIIKSVLIPVRDSNGAVCYEVKKVLVPIRPELTFPNRPDIPLPIIPNLSSPQQNVTKVARKQSKVDDRKHKSLNDQIKCSYCQEVCDTRELLSKHIHTFHEISYRCVHCHQTYDLKADYKKHARTHETDTYVECPFCQQRYKRMCGLRRHQIRMHSNIEPKFICDHCDKRFKLKTDLALHIDRIHMNVARACQYCGKFFRNVMLDERQHVSHKKKKTVFQYFKCHRCTSKTGFECDQCNAVFVKPTTLATHKYRKHKPSILCTICKKSFKYRNNFYRHVLTHGDSRPFKCDVCYKDFATKGWYVKHRKTHPGTLQGTPNRTIAAMARRILQDY